MKGGNYLKNSSFKKLLRTISKNWRLFLVVIILTTISGYLLSAYGLTKHYITSAEIYIESLDEQSSVQKAATCKLLFTSPQMYNTLNDNLQYGFSYAEYEKMIHVEQINDTQLLKIEIDCDNSIASYKLMTIYLEHLSEVIVNYKENATFRIVRDPEEPAKPSFPNDKVFTIGGGIIGILIAIIGTIIIWKLDNTITADDDITEIYNIPLLGALPDFDNEIDYLGR